MKRAEARLLRHVGACRIQAVARGWRVRRALVAAKQARTSSHALNCFGSFHDLLRDTEVIAVNAVSFLCTRHQVHRSDAGIETTLCRAPSSMQGSRLSVACTV